MGEILANLGAGFLSAVQPLTSMVSNQNDLTVFVTRPVSAVVLACAAIVLVWPVVKRVAR